MSARADVGLDWFRSNGLHPGRPVRKKRKSKLQSLYAPPQNPSSRHLIAANPFDDNPNTPFRVHPSCNAHVTQMVSSTTDDSALKRNPALPFIQNPTRLGFNQFNGFNSNFHNHFGRPPLLNGVRNKVHLACHSFQRTHAQNFYRLQQPNSWRVSNPAMGYLPPHFYHVNTPAEQTNISIHPELIYQHNKPVPKPNQAAYNSNTHSSLYHPTFNYIEPEINNHLGQQVKDDRESNASIGVRSCKGRRRYQTREDEEKILKVPCGQSANSLSESVYLCGICKSKVENGQHALLCEVSCRSWFHRTCTGMTKAAYSLLVAETSAVWGCDHCMVKENVPLTLKSFLPALKCGGSVKTNTL